MSSKSLFEQVGGLATLQKVHKVFYDKVYADAWLGQFFEGHTQAAIEARQTQFMAEKMGGPVQYMGKPLKLAHRQFYITQELFDYREQLLERSLEEVGVAAALIERWLKIDRAFTAHIVKPSKEGFLQEALSWKYEKPLIYRKPSGQ